MNKIDSRSKTVREMLDGAKYSIEYYQREYKWGTKQIEELLEDLENRFYSSYEEGHERRPVKEYAPYFLGSVIINSEDGNSWVIDGQQRLTSLTLLLIYLNNLQQVAQNGRVAVDSLIFSVQFGEKSFNFDVPDRTPCMKALYSGEQFDASGKSESVQNLVARYADIERLFPDTLKGGALPYFIDWLKEKVELVQITAYSDDDAYMIFETMNDRGLGLSPTDMLKGYLLDNISDPRDKDAANALWKGRVLDLAELGNEEEADFLKTWLRAKYARSIRERRKGASNRDFETIGTEFHKWVRDDNNRKSLIGLNKSADFDDFIRTRFDRFSKHYIRLQRAAWQVTPGLEYVYYNAFTLQYPLLLAALRVDDDDTVLRKLRLVSGYLDIYIARRIVNVRTLSYSSLSYTMFNLVKDIRDLGVPELAVVLRARLDDMWETFDAVSNFHMHQQNRWRVHYLLARITHHIEDASGVASSFESYVASQIKKPFEVEHIWADKYDRHATSSTARRPSASTAAASAGCYCSRAGSTRATGPCPTRKGQQVHRAEPAGQDPPSAVLRQQPVFHVVQAAERAALPRAPGGVPQEGPGRAPRALPAHLRGDLEPGAARPRNRVNLNGVAPMSLVRPCGSRWPYRGWPTGSGSSRPGSAGEAVVVAKLGPPRSQCG